MKTTVDPMVEELQRRANALAMKRSEPWCSCCYLATGGNDRCPRCGTDDLMRALRGVGVDWGTEWIVQRLLKAALREVTQGTDFAEHYQSWYDEEIVLPNGYLIGDLYEFMRQHDNVSLYAEYRDWLYQTEAAGEIISFDDGDTHYWVEDVDEWLSGEGV